MSRLSLFDKLQYSSMYGKINYIKPFDKVVVPLWINIQKNKFFNFRRYHYSHKDKHLAHIYEIKTIMISKRYVPLYFEPDSIKTMYKYGIIFDEYIKKESE